jgi:hypothetical protein
MQAPTPRSKKKPSDDESCVDAFKNSLRQLQEGETAYMIFAAYVGRKLETMKNPRRRHRCMSRIMDIVETETSGIYFTKPLCQKTFKPIFLLQKLIEFFFNQFFFPILIFPN